MFPAVELQKRLGSRFILVVELNAEATQLRPGMTADAAESNYTSASAPTWTSMMRPGGGGNRTRTISFGSIA